MNLVHDCLIRPARALAQAVRPRRPTILPRRSLGAGAGVKAAKVVKVAAPRLAQTMVGCVVTSMAVLTPSPAGPAPGGAPPGLATTGGGGGPAFLAAATHGLIADSGPGLTGTTETPGGWTESPGTPGGPAVPPGGPGGSVVPPGGPIGVREPSTLAVFGSLLLGLAAALRWRRRA